MERDSAKDLAQLEQCFNDLEYCARMFGQHDWLNRRIEELKKYLNK